MNDESPIAPLNEPKHEPDADPASPRAPAGTRVLAHALREQVRHAIVRFIQGLLDAPENRRHWKNRRDLDVVARQLWGEGLIVAYRLLFLLKLETGSDAAQRFRFTQSYTWLEQLSPSAALAKLIAAGKVAGESEPQLAAKRLRELFRLFCEGSVLDGARVVELGGTLFGKAGTPLIDAMHWSERAATELLRTLLWIGGHLAPFGRRARVPYERLQVEDLGGIYEWLLEFEPGIAKGPMCRLRRGKLEVVVPLAHGDRYRTRASCESRETSSRTTPPRARPTATKLCFIEEIPKGCFYLRTGLGRKASGSYYTPRAFVRFLVRETLGPQVAKLSPTHAPNPQAILSFRILDPAMGTGHFLVQACRFLGQALFDARSALDEPGPLTLAECRTLVARHCLYGIDKNPLAVELARAAIWLETQGNLPLTFTENHLVAGDSVTGPTLEHLFALPGSDAPLERCSPAPHLSQRLRQRLNDLHREQNGSIRNDFRLLAASWAGAVMLGGGAGNDTLYARLAAAVAAGVDCQKLIEDTPQLRYLAEVGREGVVYELEFPEVFAPERTGGGSGAFDAVIGNPPWDAIKFNTKEFLANFDLRVLEAPTKKERDHLEAELTQSPEIAAQFETYQQGFERLKRSNDRLFSHQKLTIDGDLAGRQLDLYRVVLERSCMVLRPTGYLGLVVPSSFHTAAGAAGVRKLITEQHRLLKYLSFVNSRKAFDISATAEFGLLVAAGVDTPKATAQARFGIEDPELLTSPDRLRLLEFPIESLCKGNPYLTFPTARDDAELSALASCRSGGKTFEQLTTALGIDIRSTPTSVHMTHEAKHFVQLQRRSGPGHGGALLHEGATFNRFTDRWEAPPRLGIKTSRLLTNPRWNVLVQHYKLALRAIVGTSKDKSIAAVLPPGCLVANSALVEGSPEQRPNAHALALLGLLNSTVFSWLLSFYADLNVNLFALKYLPVPERGLPLILSHHALRLTCNHAGYAPLWREQLGELWRESTPVKAWPVLESDERRSATRASIDAVVAHLYGIERCQYAHVLVNAKHLYPSGPEQCLAAFDELRALGLLEYAKRSDPYWDVPTVTALPSPAAALDDTATH